MQHLENLSPDEAREFFTGNSVDFIEQQFPDIYQAIARRANGQPLTAAPAEPEKASRPAGASSPLDDDDKREASQRSRDYGYDGYMEHPSKVR